QKEQVSILGASGAGKSTLLHILGTLDQPSSGTIMIDGVNVSQLTPIQLSILRNQQIGFVFQFHHLLPELTAVENVMLPGLIKGDPRNELLSRAEMILEEVGLKNRLTHKPAQLSGGEQQRVALARALVMNPKLLLADEITGNLDQQTGWKIFELLQKVAAQHGTTMVFVTHDLELAKNLPRQLHLIDGVIPS
ncbi:MAG TPA: ABC transporter ATP-binding protein, partial [Bdellovibrionota bacterium]|nr:ABC transporter ATP-binding protein [Bdellovibrionota bacterium]